MNFQMSLVVKITTTLMVTTAMATTTTTSELLFVDFNWSFLVYLTNVLNLKQISITKHTK